MYVRRLFELVPAFERKIQPEETWLYKNPRTSSYVPVPLLYVSELLLFFSSFANEICEGEWCPNNRINESNVPDLVGFDFRCSIVGDCGGELSSTEK